MKSRLTDLYLGQITTVKRERSFVICLQWQLGYYELVRFQIFAFHVPKNPASQFPQKLILSLDPYRLCQDSSSSPYLVDTSFDDFSCEVRNLLEVRILTPHGLCYLSGIEETTSQ